MQINTHGRPIRDYASALFALREQLAGAGGTLEQRLACVVRLYWDHFGFVKPEAGPQRARGVSWCGFYRGEREGGEGGEGEGVGRSMTLVCREPKPACSPIGLQGMCGRSWLAEATYVVRDVRVLGPNYIACDPRDQSELVVPVWDMRAKSGPWCWGVFDVDSYDVASFDERDARGAMAMLEAAGLCPPSLLERVPVVL